MNEAAIKKFLATEVMGLRLGRIGNYWIDDTTGGRIATYDFDPIHDVSHAFMVQDVIVKMDDKVKRKYAMWLEDEDVVDHNDTVDYLALFEIVHASPKQRCIAAVRALASDKQKKEWL